MRQPHNFWISKTIPLIDYFDKLAKLVVWGVFKLLLGAKEIKIMVFKNWRWQLFGLLGIFLAIALIASARLLVQNAKADRHLYVLEPLKVEPGSNLQNHPDCEYRFEDAEDAEGQTGQIPWYRCEGVEIYDAQIKPGVLVTDETFWVNDDTRGPIDYATGSGESLVRGVDKFVEDAGGSLDPIGSVGVFCGTVGTYVSLNDQDQEKLVSHNPILFKMGASKKFSVHKGFLSATKTSGGSFDYFDNDCNQNLTDKIIHSLCYLDSNHPQGAGYCILFARDREESDDSTPSVPQPVHESEVPGGGASTRVVDADERADAGLDANRGGPADPNPEPDPAIESGYDACDGGIGIDWALCSLLWGVSNGIEAIERQIYSFLRIDRVSYQPNDCDGTASESRACNYYDAWGNIRNLMTLAVVGTAILMVLATALDFGWFSNYTVKKYLARLIVGVILMIMSWAIGDFIIHISNQLGGFAGNVITAPFEGASEIGLESIFSGTEDKGVAEGTSIAVAGAGAVAVGIVALSGGLGLVPVLLTAALGLLAIIFGFMFLVFREMVIIAMLVFAPLGVALWFLPGSDRMWKLYYKTFLSLVFIYPIIVSVIAFGRVFIWVLQQSDDNPALITLISFMVYVGMFMAIPFLFKKFMGAINQITGGQNNPAKGIFDRAKNARRGYMDKAKELRRGVRDKKDDDFRKDLEARRAQNKADGLDENHGISRSDIAKYGAGTVRRRYRSGAPITRIARRSTVDAARMAINNEQAARYNSEVEQLKGGALDQKYNIDGGNFAARNEDLEQIASGVNPRADGQEVSMAEQEAAMRILAENKQDGSIISAYREMSTASQTGRDPATRQRGTRFNQAWSNMARDGTLFKHFEKTNYALATNQIEPSKFNVGEMSEEILLTQKPQMIQESMQPSIERLIAEANTGSVEAQAQISGTMGSIDRMLESDMMLGRMQPGAETAYRELKAIHDRSIKAQVDSHVTQINTLDGRNRDFQLALQTTNKGQTRADEIGRRAAIQVAASDGNSNVLRQFATSKESLVQESFKSAVRDNIFDNTAIQRKAPHIAKMEINKDGDIDRLEDVDWMKLGLSTDQLSDISTDSARDMMSWFEANIAEGRSNQELGQNMLRYSSQFIRPAVADTSVANPELSRALNQIDGFITQNISGGGNQPGPGPQQQ